MQEALGFVALVRNDKVRLYASTDFLVSIIRNIWIYRKFLFEQISQKHNFLIRKKLSCLYFRHVNILMLCLYIFVILPTHFCCLFFLLHLDIEKIATRWKLEKLFNTIIVRILGYVVVFKLNPAD